MTLACIDTGPSRTDAFEPFLSMPGALLCVLNSEGDAIRTSVSLRELLSGREIREQICDADRPAFDQALRECGQEASAEVRIRLVDQTTTLAWKFVRSPDGLIYGSAWDITQKRAAESLLRQAIAERTAELTASIHELDAFAFSVSHDLRAPLRAIDGFSRLLMQDCGEDLGEEGVGYLERIRAASQRMSGIIDSLLSLSRLTRLQLEPKVVDLSAFATQVLEDLQRRHPDRDVAILVEPGVTVFADPRWMRLLLEQLLENAWKFTSKTPRAKIEFGSHEDTIYVRDNGAGFNMAYSNRLFQPFERLHNTREFPGEGIGLATAFRIIARHGGTISAMGAPGEGATIKFTIPRAVGPKVAATTSTVAKDSL